MDVYKLYAFSLLNRKVPTVKNTLPLFATVLLSALLHAPTAVAAETPQVNPLDQPLVVLRADDARYVEQVLDTRQAKALGLDKKDFSGTLPGVDARVDSLRALMAAMAYGKYANLWYCMLQEGSSLTKQTGAMGFDAVDAKPDAELPQVATWLKEIGLDIDGRDVELRKLGPDRLRLMISRDSQTRDAIVSGAKRGDAGWRGSLNSFLSSPGPGVNRTSVGVWANTRPILGLLSLVTGIDFRAHMNSRNLDVPVSTQVELFNNQGDLGFELRMNNLLPADWRDSSPPPILVHSRKDALLELNLPAFGGIWELLNVEKDVFFLANINILPLVPRSVNMAVWRNDDGKLSWSLVALMANKQEFNAQLKRVHSWLQFLSAASSSTFGLDTVKSRWGDELWNIRLGEASMAAGVVDVDAAGANNAFLVLSGAVNDWPNPYDLSVEAGKEPCLVEWNAKLDPVTRRDLVATLADFARERGMKDFTSGVFEQLLPEVDAGSIGTDKNALVVRSLHGMLPLLIPGLLEMYNHGVNKESEVRTVAGRLRFLLDVANQSRFRDLGMTADRPVALPESFEELASGAVRRWLDAHFKNFPGEAYPVSSVIAGLAGGRPLDGFHYAIDTASGNWGMTADDDAGLRLRIDAKGQLFRQESGSWTPYQEALLPGINN